MAGSMFNKVAMAFLAAVLIAMLVGFFSKKLYHPTVELAENAYKIEVAETEAAPAAAEEPAGPEPVSALLASADVAAGQALSRPCAACHTFDKGGANRVGPNLWNVVNGPHAHVDGFAYSDAMAALKDKPWDYEALNAFLANPKQAIPGTKMNYAGMRKVQDRANLIAWMRTLSDDPAPLPQ